MEVTENLKEKPNTYGRWISSVLKRTNVNVFLPVVKSQLNESAKILMIAYFIFKISSPDHQLSLSSL